MVQHGSHPHFKHKVWRCTAGLVLQGRWPVHWNGNSGTVHCHRGMQGATRSWCLLRKKYTCILHSHMHFPKKTALSFQRCQTESRKENFAARSRSSHGHQCTHAGTSHRYCSRPCRAARGALAPHPRSCIAMIKWHLGQQGPLLSRERSSWSRALHSHCHYMHMTNKICSTTRISR